MSSGFVLTVLPASRQTSSVLADSARVVQSGIHEITLDFDSSGDIPCICRNARILFASLLSSDCACTTGLFGAPDKRCIVEAVVAVPKICEV